MCRCVENAFGHLKGAFRVLSKPWTQDPIFLSQVIRVCVALHNIRKLDDDPYLDSEFTAEEQAAQVPEADDDQAGNRQTSPSSNATRDYILRNYIAKMDD